MSESSIATDNGSESLSPMSSVKVTVLELLLASIVPPVTAEEAVLLPVFVLE